MSMNEESMNKEPENFDQWLTSQLQLSETYLDDNGFTDAVIRKLPGRHLDDLTATLLPTLTALITSTLVIWHFPVLGLLIDIGVSLSMLNSTLAVAGGLLFVVLTSAAGIWALKRDI